MKTLFPRNISNQGRVARGIISLLCFVGAGFFFELSAWLGLLLAASGAFVFFEALRGWCALRACGIKTRL
jgi:hypothetical protein